MADAQTAVSSTASDSPDPSATLAAASDEAIAKWRETGDLAALSPADPPVAVADSTPAPPAQAASTDALPKADSEPAANPKTEARFQELLADRAKERERADKLERELAALRAPAAHPIDAKPAVSSAAPAGDPEPNPEDAAKYPDGLWDRKFLKDQAAWEARSVLRAERAAAEEATRAQHAKTQSKQMEDAWTSRMTATKALHPDFDELALDKLIPAGSPIDRWVLENDGIEGALNFLSKNPAEIARLLALPVTQQMRALIRLEETTKAPPAKTISDAPDPAITLGRRVTASADAVERALAAKDVGAYIAEQNRREMASSRH